MTPAERAVIEAAINWRNQEQDDEAEEDAIIAAVDALGEPTECPGCKALQAENAALRERLAAWSELTKAVRGILE